MPDPKYLIVFKGWTTAVPSSLRPFIAKKINEVYAQFDLELDFSDTRHSRDLLVTFTNEIPDFPAYGVSMRVRGGNSISAGVSTVYTRKMKMMRLMINATSCEPAFPETEESLGSMIANVTMHEMGHNLGLDTGGYDDGGHTTDKANRMWDPSSMAEPDTHASPTFVYTVKKGDTMIGITHRYVAGTLDNCRIGWNGLTYKDVWSDPENKANGFVADPAKGGVRGRRANDPNWIYPGEKVALANNNLRTQAYKHRLPGYLGDKSFTSQQIDTIKQFIAQRLADGKG
jgi:hypothetical protein